MNIPKETQELIDTARTLLFVRKRQKMVPCDPVKILMARQKVFILQGRNEKEALETLAEGFKVEPEAVQRMLESAIPVPLTEQTIHALLSMRPIRKVESPADVDYFALLAACKALLLSQGHTAKDADAILIDRLGITKRQLERYFVQGSFSPNVERKLALMNF